MDKQKSAKYNTNYFAKSDTLKLAGMACIALLILLYFLGRIFFSPGVSYLLMCVCAPLGFVLFLVGSLGRTSDSDMDNIVARKTLKVEFDLEANKRFERNLVKHLPIHVAEGYEYRGEHHLKKAKSGVLRSNEYFKSVIYTFKDEIIVVVRRVELINETESTENYIFPIKEITNINVVSEKLHLTYGKKTFLVASDHLHFMNGDKELLNIPFHSDIIFEQYIEKLNEHITARRAELEAE